MLPLDMLSLEEQASEKLIMYVSNWVLVPLVC